MPPLVEFTDSLLTGTGHDLDLRTFKLVDQLSGKMMGVRADITPQVARIDAHLLNRAGVTRLCYAGSVLHARPATLGATREPIQIGAEIYGHAGFESDLEIHRLLCRALELAGVRGARIDIGHVAVFRSLVRAAAIGPELEAELFEALQNKATTDIERLLGQHDLPAHLSECLRLLPTLHGDTRVLATARMLFSKCSSEVLAALDQLDKLASAIRQRFPQQQIYLDLCELRGYDYHTGVIFSAYVDGCGDAIANGGRYDGIGAAFGRTRAATGFDTDLLTLLGLSKRQFPQAALIYAPAANDAALQRTIDELRAQGKRVVQAFPGQQDQPAALGCTQQLVKKDNGWQVTAL